MHELIGIQDNKVDLGNIGKLPKDQQVGVYSLLIFVLSLCSHEW